MQTPSKEDYLSIIKSLPKETLSVWEKGFIESLYDRLVRKNQELTSRQSEVLIRIWDAHLRVARIDSSWNENWDEARAKNFSACCEYYRDNGGGYYRNIWSKFFEDPEFIPTRRQYMRVCDNKYAKKILEATSAEPKFEVGQVVKVRSTAAWGVSNAFPSKLGIVLQINAAPVTSAAKGAKPYLILPYGSSKSLIVEERDLKKPRKNE